MNKFFTLLFFMALCLSFNTKPKQYIARQGQISFFSYTSVENIEAKNNQVLSILDIENNEIAVSMLMRTFIFKKSLMYEHFNESYIESDIFPKANFSGKIIDFDASNKGTQIKIIRGILTIHGKEKEIDIKTTIKNNNGVYVLQGEFSITVKDFDIKIPPILSSNIAKNIAVKFVFNYVPYEK